MTFSAISRSPTIWLAVLLPLALACNRADHDHDHDQAGEHDHDPGTHDHEAGGVQEHAHGSGDAWAVTAFGARYEIFAEADPLAVGASSRSHTHVTVLDGFTALTEGRVEAILSAPGLDDQVFTATEPVRAGIFDIVLEARQTGTFSLRFRVEASTGNETIDAGSVIVGAADQPGGLIAATFSPAAPIGEPTPFLKEQQWQTAFATAWARPGALADSVRGPAMVRPAAGGEVVLTAPVEGVLSPTGAWPHPGRAVRSGERLFTLTPRRTDARSPAELEASVIRRSAELEVLDARLERLEKLLAIEAVSKREVEEARAEAVSTKAELEAARQDLAAELSARRGGTSKGEGTVSIKAPFAAQVAAVMVSPGETVSAGAALARLVVPRPVWVEVRLPPVQAMRFDGSPSGLLLHAAGGAEIELAGEDLELVARQPEVEAATGTVGVIFAVARPPASLLPGLRAEAEVLLPTAREGIVVPREALVDDSGVDVVYIQQDGESFSRREVTVLARQGDRVLIDGLRAGERLVVRGGPTLRRAALLATGVGRDHVH